jgi:serine/threonine protein kinase
VEADMLCNLHHPRIVRFRRFIADDATGDFAALEMAYAAGGCLMDKIVQRSPPGPCLSARDTARIMYDILQALLYLQLQKIHHLDIK